MSAHAGHRARHMTARRPPRPGALRRATLATIHRRSEWRRAHVGRSSERPEQRRGENVRCSVLGDTGCSHGATGRLLAHGRRSGGSVAHKLDVRLRDDRASAIDGSDPSSAASAPERRDCYNGWTRRARHRQRSNGDESQNPSVSERRLEVTSCRTTDERESLGCANARRCITIGQLHGG